MAEPKKKARPVAGITQHPEKRRCGIKEPCKKMLREAALDSAPRSMSGGLTGGAAGEAHSGARQWRKVCIQGAVVSAGEWKARSKRTRRLRRARPLTF